MESLFEDMRPMSLGPRRFGIQTQSRSIFLSISRYGMFIANCNRQEVNKKMRLNKMKRFGGSILGLLLFLGIIVLSGTTAQAQYPWYQNQDQYRRQREYERQRQRELQRKGQLRPCADSSAITAASLPSFCEGPPSRPLPDEPAGVPGPAVKHFRGSRRIH